MVIARAFHHTGPGQSERYVLADWAGQVRKGVESIKVGNIEVERDFADVRDIVAGTQCSLNKGFVGRRTTCTGSARLLLTFACMTEGRNITVEVDVTDCVRPMCSSSVGPKRAFALG